MKTLLRIVVCWFVFVISLVASGIAIRMFHLPTMEIPGGARPGLMFALSLVAGMVLVLGLWPIARGLSGSFPYRAVALVAFLALAFGVNNLIETRAFTTVLDNGIAALAFFYLTIAVLLGLTMAALFGSGEPVARGRRGDMPLLIMRVVAAWFAFP